MLCVPQHVPSTHASPGTISRPSSPLCLGSVLGTVSVLLWMGGVVAEAPPNLQVYRGQVIRLGEVVKEETVQLDPDAAPFCLALRTSEGKLLPIVKTLGSRALFQDSRLLNRPVELQARRLSASDILVVYRFYTLKNGKPHEVYYWCETCAIRRDYPDNGVCECCGGPMELREVPLSR